MKGKTRNLVGDESAESGVPGSELEDIEGAADGILSAESDEDEGADAEILSAYLDDDEGADADDGESSVDDTDDGDSSEPEGGEAGGEGDEPGGGGKQNGKNDLILINPAYTRRLPLSLIAAVIGGFLGLIPVTLYAYLFDSMFYPFFLVAPLLIYLLNSLLKGGRDIRSLIIIAIFSLASAYVAAIACQAALFIALYNIPISELPSITYHALDSPSVIPASASVRTYPLIFTLLGVVVAWELLPGKRNADI